MRTIGWRDDYNATLATLKRICWALDVAPGDMLEIVPHPPKPKRTKKKTRTR